jgi:hypothetical protein
MAFAQLTYRESLRDIQCCLRTVKDKLYHMGIRGKISRSTLADANEKRDWRIYRDFAQILIAEARELYADDDFGLRLDETVYALDATIIDLCLSLFPWAHFRQTKAAIKMHTLLDLRGNIPSFFAVTHGKYHESNIWNHLQPELGAIYVMDRAYLDFKRLYWLQQIPAFFVIRTKSNTALRRLYSSAVDKDAGIRCDQIVYPVTYQSKKTYPEKLRRIKYYDSLTDKRLTFITNHLRLSAATIAAIYKRRWQVEVFFKWIKQHLRIKRFYGISENAVRTQICIAISVYVLVAIIKKRLKIELSLYTILQILSITIFEKMPILQVLTESAYKNQITSSCIQLKLFDS